MNTVAVGVGDCNWSKNPDDVLVTYALGSCIAILIHDPLAKVAGLLHFMLPASDGGAADPLQRPYVYADTGIPQLFLNSYKMGADKKRLIVSAFGGAQVLDPEGTFNIGKRNHLAMRKIFWKAGVMVKVEEVGGTLSRTVRIEVGSGKILLQHGDEKREMNPSLSTTTVTTAAKETANGLQRSHS